MSKKNKTEQNPVEEKKDQQEAAAQPETETVSEIVEETDIPQDTEKQAEQESPSITMTAEEFQAAKEHIAKLQKERDDTVILLQRNQADFDNFRRRNASVRTESLEEGKVECITQLLPVLDNFDRALEQEASSQDSAWREGICMVYRQLMDVMQKMGVSQIPDSGKFDPTLHNAVMQEKVEGKESGEIIAVFQKGYQVKDRIIRHTLVKVAE